MSQYDNIVSGYYTATGSAKSIPIPFTPSWFELHIQGNSSGDNWNSVANPGVLKSAWWSQGMASASALGVYNTAGAATDVRTFVSSDGISPITTEGTILGTPTAITGITNAAPPVVTTAGAHGYSSGDVVILTNTTGVLQIATIPFEITVLSPTTFSLNNMGAPGSIGTAGFSVKVLFPSVYLPMIRFITGVTQAVIPTITFSVDHGYVVGQTIRLYCPSAFGADEIDGEQAVVLSVPSASTITVDIDASQTTFAFPTSAIASLGTSFPMATPIGVSQTVINSADPLSAYQYALNTAFRDAGYQGMMLGATVAGPSGALVLWRASSSIKVYTS